MRARARERKREIAESNSDSEIEGDKLHRKDIQLIFFQHVMKGKRGGELKRCS